MDSDASGAAQFGVFLADRRETRNVQRAPARTSL